MWAVVPLIIVFVINFVASVDHLKLSLPNPSFPSSRSFSLIHWAVLYSSVPSKALGGELDRAGQSINHPVDNLATSDFSAHVCGVQADRDNAVAHSRQSLSQHK